MLADTLFVVTVGYRPEVVVEELFAYGIRGNPGILLVGLALDEEAEHQLRDAMKAIKEKLPGQATIEERVYRGDFTAVLESLSKDVMDSWTAKGKLVFLLSGGSRLLILAATLAATALSQEYLDQVHVYVGKDYEATILYEVDVYAAANTPRITSHTSLQIAEYLLEKGPATTTRISKDLGLSPPTVSRNLRRLEEYGLITRVKGTTKYKATQRARTVMVLARLAGLWP